MVDFILNDEQIEYRKLASEFAQKTLRPEAHRFDTAAEAAPQILSQAWESGLAHVQIGAEFGGLGLGCWDAAVIAEELGAGCSGLTAALEASALALLPVLKFASAEQKGDLLKPLLDEFALAGVPLDLFSEVLSDGLTAEKRSDGFVLSGELSMVSNASLCRWLLVAAHSAKGLTLLVVPSLSPGVELLDKPYSIGRRASDLRGVRFKDVVVSTASIIGREGAAQSHLDAVRPAAYVLLASGSIGVARSAMEHAVRYAKERTTFGQAIGQHQAVAFMLADMAKEIESSRLLTWQAARLVDMARDSLCAARVARSFSQEMAVKVATDAVQIYGGYGYSKEYPVEKLMRDAKMYQMFDGRSNCINYELGRELIGVFAEN